MVINMKFKKLLSILLAAITLLSATAPLSACANKDELGNRYKTKTNGMDAATSALENAHTLTEAITDIEYAIALMVHCEYAGEIYDIGLKNAYYVTGKGSDSVNAYCTKTYYGIDGNIASAYYLKDGYIYTEFCNTLINAPMNENEFYDYVETTDMTAKTVFFERSYYSEGCYYTYSDGTSAVVMSGANDELGEMIASILGFSETDYSYTVEDIILRYNINIDGTISDCDLDFNIDYYDVMTPNNVITYDGEFGFSINATGNAVKVKSPQAGLDYHTVSSLEKLKLLLSCYETLISYTSISAVYNRKVVNTDASDAKYSLDSTAKFTQSYLDEIYKYGSIDTEISSTPNGETLSSVGIFVDGDGMYHYRDLEGNNNSDRENTYTVEEWLANFAATMTEEYFYEEDICKLTVSEDEEFITFTYEYSDDAVPYYAEYLLDMFSENKGELDISGYMVTATKNSGTVKVRLSDGCLVYHSMEFEAFIGYSICVSGTFSLEITATEDVDVLTTTDWAIHERTFG